MIKKQILIIVTLLLLASPASLTLAEEARGSNEKFWDVNFYLENDLFASTDSNYTNGIRLSFMASEIDNIDKNLPGLLASLNRKLLKLYKIDTSNLTSQYNFVATVGQRMYTPTDDIRTDLIGNDRPYAGWLYLGLANHTRERNNMTSFELDIGMIGPASFAQEAQDFVHTKRKFDKFLGWQHQLNNEPAFSFIFERKRKFSSKDILASFGADLITHWGGSVGTVATYLNTGVEARFGWDIPDDFGTSSLRPAGDNTAPGATNTPGNGVHLFASMDARWVGRDIFLDGNTFSDSHSVARKNFVADTALGLSMNIGALKLSFARIFRTKEFDLQDHHHSYGSVAISYWRKI